MRASLATAHCYSVARVAALLPRLSSNLTIVRSTKATSQLLLIFSLRFPHH